MKTILLSLALAILPFTVVAETKSNGGTAFRNAAQEYASKASAASSRGQTSEANIYSRLAEIKGEAAKLADQGKWSDIDWSEYHQLTAQLSKKDGKHKHKK